MKITGLKKAIGDYNKSNKGGKYSPEYGILVFDTADGTVWTDVFCDIGHNSYRQYDSPSIINLSKAMTDAGLAINMQTAKEYINKHYA